MGKEKYGEPVGKKRRGEAGSWTAAAKGTRD
jgi:hypothetical protein